MTRKKYAASSKAVSAGITSMGTLSRAITGFFTAPRTFSRPPISLKAVTAFIEKTGRRAKPGIPPNFSRL
jgi:hypothetical protein